MRRRTAPNRGPSTLLPTPPRPTSRHPTSLLLALLVVVPSPILTAQTGRADQAVLDSIAAAPVRANRAVGLVAAVVRGGGTLLLKAYGRADVEWEVPMAVDAMFEVGSIAKQFTAVAILQLQDAGLLTLDDPVTRWLPFLGTSGQEISLRQLLNHTSGIFPFTEEAEWESNYFAPRFPRDSAQRLIRLEPFQYPTGEAQAYSNSGFWLLGLVVEKASGMPLEEYFAQRIFEPLGMTRSMYCNSAANVPRRAHGYGIQGGSIRRMPNAVYTWVFAPGAICSTAADLVIWLQALHGGQVLSPASYAQLITPATLRDGTALQYGLGIKVGEDYRGLRYIGHGGTAPGFRADATWYPEGQLAVVVLMNTSPTNLVPAGVGNALAQEVLPWPRMGEMTYYTGDPLPFVGRYQVVAGGNQGAAIIEVSATPTGLAFSVNGSPPEPLPWAGGLTFYAGATTTLTFERAKSGDGPMAELRRDNAGNHTILRRQ